ncbi:MAG TPA: hypothetical protein DDZ78_02885, partial [Porphyromonadaceae bacterium]|nr:hypothetical protein [Porphyromonadaceae bacterium]
QNMEFGDIIYFILLVFFVILGFFNNSKEEKDSQKKQKKSQLPPLTPVFRPGGDWLEPKEKKNYDRQRSSPTPPPVHTSSSGPTPLPSRDFKSSLTLTADLNRYSSASQSLFVDEEGEKSVYRNDASGANTAGRHWIISDLQSDSAKDELRKGIIYSELLKTKF